MMYIYIMERTQIYLSKDENAALERESRATGRSKSQLIREAIDRIYLNAKRADLLSALKRSWGSWRGRRESGAAWVERLRSGRLARVHGVGHDRHR